VPIEPDGQSVDLALELAETPGQPVALVPERLGHRHDRLDEPAFAVVGGYAFAHRRSSGKSSRPRQQFECRDESR
jgi:hypothetical protein